MKDKNRPLVHNMGMQMFQTLIENMHSNAWAITPEWLNRIHGIVAGKIHGVDCASDYDDQHYSNKMEIKNGVAIIPIQGAIFPKANMMTHYSGATSLEIAGRDFKSALANDEVTKIVQRVSSPGGTIAGTKEYADLVFNSRGKKPIVTFVENMAASAGYWVGSAGDEIIASSETAIIGSVGVIMAHYDYSAWDAQDGLKRTFIYQGKYKGISNDAQPLSKEGKEDIQEMIDGLFSIFIDSVAENLGVTSDKALDMTNGSKVFNAKEALGRGLIHKIDSFENVIGGGRPDEKNTALGHGGAEVLTVKTAGNGADADNIQTLENEEESVMNEAEIRSKFPEVVASIETKAKDGLVPKADLDTSEKAREDAEGALVEKDVLLKAQKENITELKGEVAIGKEASHKVTAGKIQDAILADSGLPENIHGDMKDMVTHSAHVKDGEEFACDSEGKADGATATAFATAFTSKVRDFEDKLGCKGEGGPGTGSNRTDETGTVSADEELGRELAREVTGKIRSDAE